MNSDNIDKLIGDALGAEAASDIFKKQLLRGSTAAFMRGRTLQKRLRVTGLISVILLVTAAAFMCGRLSVSSQVADVQMIVQDVGARDDWVRVSKDLVAWLDAARFFTRLGMDGRAALSYKQASELIPYDIAGSQRASFGTQNVLACMLQDLKITGRCSKESFERTDSARVFNEYWGGLELPHEVLSNIIPLHFGG